MAIQAAQLDGLIKTTLPHIVRERQASIAESLTKYIGFKSLFPKKESLPDGVSVQWNIITDESHTAMPVGLFDTIAPHTSLDEIQATVPWRHTRVHTSWDLREVAMNKAPARIVNYIKAKIFAMDLSEIQMLETQIWSGPSAGDDQSPFGLWGYWINSPLDGGTNNNSGVFAETSTGGRVNVNPTAVGSAGPGNVSRVTYPRISNWYQNYASVTYASLFAAMRRGFDETDFESPVSYSTLKDGAPKFGIYCTQDDARAAADECRLQNENIGSDLAYYDGRAMVRGVHIQGVPKLNALDAARATANHPFIQVDWSQLKPITLEGIDPYETTETGGSNQPMVVTRARYRTWNVRAWNCKTMALYTQNTTTG